MTAKILTLPDPAQSGHANEQEAVGFLKSFDPNGWHNLVAVDPEEKQGPVGRTFAPGQWDAISSFVKRFNGKRNLYWSVNEPLPGSPDAKLSKSNIGRARAVYVDIDPEKGADLASERERILSKLESFYLRPALVIDSGGGFQAFWPLTGDTKADAAFEDQLNGARLALDGDKNCTNLDRIMRLPGTINLPNAAKRAVGRTKSWASVAWYDGEPCSLAEFAECIPRAARPKSKHDSAAPREPMCDADLDASVTEAIDYLVNRAPEAIEGGGGGYGKTVEVIRMLHDFGLSESKAHDLLLEHWNYTKAHGPWEPHDLWEKVVSLYQNPQNRFGCKSPVVTRNAAVDFAADEEIDVSTMDIGESPIKKAREAANQNKPNGFLSYDQMVVMPEPIWLIEGLIQKQTAALMFGKSNTFKSFLAIDMLLSLASGRHWHGQTVRPGRGALVATEGANGVGRYRVPGWFDARDIQLNLRRNVFLRPEEVAIDNKEAVDRLIADVIALGPLDLIVLDIFGGTMLGSEVEDTTARAWVHGIQRIMRQTGAATLTVAHTGWADQTRARMHTHFWGSFDTRLRVEGDKDARTSCLSVERHKDADSTGTWGFKLHASHGTLVPELDEAVRDKGITTLSPTLKAALQTLEEIAEASGQYMSGAEWPTEKVVTLEQWKAAADARVSSSDSADSRKRAFNRAKGELISRGLVGEKDGHFWVAI